MARGIIRFTCTQFAEHEGDAEIDGPVNNWQAGCHDCRVEVVEGPFVIDWWKPEDDRFAVDEVANA